jgi:hypothetical protein
MSYYRTPKAYPTRTATPLRQKTSAVGATRVSRAPSMTAGKASWFVYQLEMSNAVKIVD